MSDLYRFKFRSEYFELELESTNVDFIEKKINQLIEYSTRPSEDQPRLLTSRRSMMAPEEAPPAEEPPVEEPAEEEAAVAEETPAAAEEAAPEAAEPVKPAKPKRGKAAAAPKRKEPKKGKKAPARPAGKKQKEPQAKAPAGGPTGAIDPQAVADYIKASDQFKAIREKILKKPNQLNRILLSFYFAERAYGGQGLTTGDIQSITEALGTGIKSTNISSQLKKHEELFNSRGERKRGSVVHYTLNDDGKKQVEQLLQGA